jgi:hypothetical protein
MNNFYHVMRYLFKIYGGQIGSDHAMNKAAAKLKSGVKFSENMHLQPANDIHF